MSFVILFITIVVILVLVNYLVNQSFKHSWGKLVWTGSLFILLITPFVFFFSLAVIGTYEKSGFAGAFAALSMGGLVLVNGIILIIYGLIRRKKQDNRKVVT